MMRRTLISLGLAIAAAAMPIAAQQDTAAAGDTAGVAGAETPARRQLEQRLSRVFGEVVRRRLQLTDEQYAQLEAVNRKYAQPRRDLDQRERYLRLSLRGELELGEKADQAKVGTYLDQLTDVQEQRLQVFREEQKDLAGFLTPVQRAKYAAIEEQLRRKLAPMRQRQIDRRAAAGARARTRRSRPPR